MLHCILSYDNIQWQFSNLDKIHKYETIYII